jgi:hypothetical protein
LQMLSLFSKRNYYLKRERNMIGLDDAVVAG